MKELSKRELAEIHLNDPKVGDYWHDMYHPVCVVVKVDSGTDTVTICKTKVAVDDDHWTWDLSVTETMTKDKLKSWLSYSGKANIGYWVDVLPEKHKWVADHVE